MVCYVLCTLKSIAFNLLKKKSHRKSLTMLMDYPLLRMSVGIDIASISTVAFIKKEMSCKMCLHEYICMCI